MVGGYKVVKKIFDGGMSTVYKGLQYSLNRPVAIKVLSKSIAHDEDLQARFNRESLIIARLAHPNIIHVIDRGITPQGMPYFVMEFVEGSNLAKVIRNGDLAINRKLDILIQVCKALSYAHKNGVIHRDMKPANVMIDREGHVRVVDFGIAQFMDDEEHDVEPTQTHVVLGTVSYMSPEQQISAKQVTTSSDLYSLGVIMYELFTGSKPLGRFQTPSQVNPEIPSLLDDLILRCLEPDPADRFSTADEIKDRLLKILQGAHLGNTQKYRASEGIPTLETKFALLDVITENEHGAVYLYENRVNHRLMVIKKRPSTSSGYNEAKLLTTLKHENIMSVLGTSKNENLFIIVMEYLGGGSLQDRLVRPLPWNEALRIAWETSRAMSFAHKNRIVHGNLRPSNILFTESRKVKITDFGLDEHYTAAKDISNWYNVTREPRSPQADMLAAGTIFYQMLTGSLPVWRAKKLLPNDEFKQLPGKLRYMISRMISLQNGTRYKSFSQVVGAIDEITAQYGGRLRVPEGPEKTEKLVDIEHSGRDQREDEEFDGVRAGYPAARRKRLIIWIMLILAIAMLMGTAFLFGYKGIIKVLPETLLEFNRGN
jgi:serine/threonine-protein kinase